jgi:hypothetical protein
MDVYGRTYGFCMLALGSMKKPILSNFAPTETPQPAIFRAVQTFFSKTAPGWSSGDSGRRSTGPSAEIEATWSWADNDFSGV